MVIYLPTYHFKIFLKKYHIKIKSTWKIHENVYIKILCKYIYIGCPPQINLDIGHHFQIVVYQWRHSNLLIPPILNSNENFVFFIHILPLEVQKASLLEYDIDLFFFPYNYTHDS